VGYHGKDVKKALLLNFVNYLVAWYRYLGQPGVVGKPGTCTINLITND
jgi:hypothetical protein